MRVRYKGQQVQVFFLRGVAGIGAGALVLGVAVGFFIGRSSASPAQVVGAPQEPLSEAPIPSRTPSQSNGVAREEVRRVRLGELRQQQLRLKGTASSLESGVRDQLRNVHAAVGEILFRLRVDRAKDAAQAELKGDEEWTAKDMYDFYEIEPTRSEEILVDLLKDLYAAQAQLAAVENAIAGMGEKP